MPMTLQDFATAELDRARTRQRFAQEDLKTNNAAVDAAKKDQTEAAKKLAQAERAAREIRAKLAEIPMPADGAALIAQLEGRIVESHTQEATTLDAEARIAAGRVRADRAAKEEARAGADVALDEARKSTADKKHDEYVQAKTRATTALASLPQDALDLLNDAARNQDFTSARMRIEGDIPAALLTRARARGQRELDALDAARTARTSREDALATELATNGGKAGAVFEKRLAFARAEAALRDFASRAEEDKAQAVQTFKAIATAPPLTQAVKDRIAALAADGAAALPAEQERDTTRAAVQAKQEQLDARIETVRDAGDDVAADTQVGTLTGELAALNATLNTKQAAFDIVKEDLDAWEAAVPESTWASLFALDEARRTLERLGALVPGTLVSDFDTAEDAYATRLGEAAAAARKAIDLEGDVAVRSAGVDALLDAKRRRVISALRGDR